jgi:hypothetical protein
MNIISDESIVDHIKTWIDYVATTETSNGFVICPHATKALKNQRLKILKYDPTGLDKLVDDFRADANTFKVWIMLADNPEIECQQLNVKYPDIVWLYDIADDTGMIDGVATGNQKYDIILMQDKAELNKMSDMLNKSGYYTNWTKRYYDQVVAWRTND